MGCSGSELRNVILQNQHRKVEWAGPLVCYTKLENLISYNGAYDSNIPPGFGPLDGCDHGVDALHTLFEMIK